MDQFNITRLFEQPHSVDAIIHTAACSFITDRWF